MLTLDTELVQITYAMQNFLTKIVIGVYTVFKFYHIFYVPHSNVGQTVGRPGKKKKNMYLVSGTEEFLSHILGALWVTKRISW